MPCRCRLHPSAWHDTHVQHHDCTTEGEVSSTRVSMAPHGACKPSCSGCTTCQPWCQAASAASTASAVQQRRPSLSKADAGHSQARMGEKSMPLRFRRQGGQGGQEGLEQGCTGSACSVKPAKVHELPQPASQQPAGQPGPTATAQHDCSFGACWDHCAGAHPRGGMMPRNRLRYCKANKWRMGSSGAAAQLAVLAAWRSGWVHKPKSAARQLMGSMLPAYTQALPAWAAPACTQGAACTPAAACRAALLTGSTTVASGVMMAWGGLGNVHTPGRRGPGRQAVRCGPAQLHHTCPSRHHKCRRAAPPNGSAPPPPHPTPPHGLIR